MKRVLIALSVGASVLLAACGGTSVANNPSTGGPVAITPPAAALTGAGATFPGPFYDAARFAYNLKFSQVTVNYQAVGSGAGIQQLTKKLVDFGASDVPMSATELAAAGGADGIVQIASTLGTESLAYNLSGVSNGQVKLTPKTIAGIFLGTIKNWNDPALAADNSGVSLPNQAITVVHRSDGSGTTYIFTDYLSTVSADWKSKVGKGKSVSWPVGQGASGNAAVATRITQTPGAIGYVELAYARAQNLTYADVKNKAGQFVEPCVKTAAAATVGITNYPPDLRIDVVDASTNPDAYPITGLTWALIYQNQTDHGKAAALVNFFSWVLTKGQDQAATANYTPLGSDLQKLCVAQLHKITLNGSPVSP